MRTAQQRIEWNALGETFIQQWTENGCGRRHIIILHTDYMKKTLKENHAPAIGQDVDTCTVKYSDRITYSICLKLFFHPSLHTTHIGLTTSDSDGWYDARYKLCMFIVPEVQLRSTDNHSYHQHPVHCLYGHTDTYSQASGSW
jgi:hypothetical protein